MCATRRPARGVRGRTWLGETELLDGAAALADVPAVFIHGQLDLGAPLEPAWLLHQAWPGSELVTVPAAGHTTASLADHASRALDHFAATTG